MGTCCLQGRATPKTDSIGEFISQLVETANSGSIESVENFLRKSNFDLDASSDDLRTALWQAVRNNKLCATQTLIKFKAKVNSECSFGETPLMHAAFNGNSNMVKILLDNGAKVDTESNNGTTAILLAAKEGHKKCLQVLLQAHSRGAEKSDKSEKRKDLAEDALNSAARNGHWKCLQILLDSSYVPTSSRINVNPALKMAIEKGMYRCVNSLINLIKASDKDFKEVDIDKEDFKEVDIDKEDFKEVDIDNLIPSALKHKHTKYVDLLIQACPEENHVWTALKLALESKKIPHIKMLLEEHDKPGRIPALIKATRSKDIKHVKLLLQTGQRQNDRCRKCISYKRNNTVLPVKVDLRDTEKKTALMHAAQEGDLECLQVLIKSGAKLEEKDKNDKTPLVHALERGHDKCVEALIEAQDTIVKKIRDCVTAIQYAEEHRSLKDRTTKYDRELYKKLKDTYCAEYQKELFRAARHGHSGYLEKLVDENTVSVSKVDIDKLLECAKSHEKCYKIIRRQMKSSPTVK